MPFVIAEPCIGVKDKSCVEVCPVNCIYEGEDQFYIHPDECIDCQACEAACPVQAIFPDNGVPEKWKPFIEKNQEFTSRTSSLRELTVGALPSRDQALAPAPRVDPEPQPPETLLRGRGRDARLRAPATARTRSAGA